MKSVRRRMLANANTAATVMPLSYFSRIKKLTDRRTDRIDYNNLFHQRAGSRTCYVYSGLGVEQ